MSADRKCPKCGSEKVQLSNVKSKHGCLWLILFGVFYVFWVLIKWMIGIALLCCYDWWMAIIKAACKKGYVWQSKKWFSGSKKVYYCHDCNHNFTA